MSKPQTENLSQASSQPRFFEGQAFTSEDLNRMAQYAAQSSAAPLGLLCGSGGIMRRVGNELRVSPLQSQGLVLEVATGTAITAQGDLLCVSKPLTLDLNNIAPLLSGPDGTREVFVYLAFKEVLTDLHRDPEFPEIEGFGTKVLGCELVAADREGSDPRAVEICRLTLTKETDRIECTKEGLTEKQPGTIDVTFRRYVSLLCGRQLSVGERQALLTEIQKARSVFVHVAEAFGVALPHALIPAWVAVGAEIYRDNLDEEALKGLLHDVRESMAAVLEDVRGILSVNSEARARKLPAVEAALHQIAAMKSFEGDVIINLRDTLRIAAAIDADLLGLNELKLKILHALSLIRHKSYARTQTIAPAGRVFSLRDQICMPVGADRIVASSPKKESVSFTARAGALAPNETLEALAVEGGEIEIAPEHLTPGKDLLVIGRVYKRRQQVALTYEWNGALVHEEQTTDEDPEHGVSLFGFVVPGAAIVTGANHLKVSVRSYELQYPFLGLEFYQ